MVPNDPTGAAADSARPAQPASRDHERAPAPSSTTAAEAGTDVAARNAETVRRLYAAVERRDGPTVWQTHDETVRIEEAPSLPYGGVYRGLEGVARHAAGYLAAWDRLQDDAGRRLAPEIIADGDRVAVLWRQRARNPATGERLDQPAVTVHRLTGGRVVESRMFHFDTHALREFLRSTDSADAAVGASERALNALIAAGEYAAALDRHYADDVVMCEMDGRETAGRAANRAREAALLRALERIEARPLGGAVAGASSYSEWEYRLAFRSGRTLEYRQVAARTWLGGRVARETFYHVPFPEWMADEIRATSADSGPALHGSSAS